MSDVKLINVNTLCYEIVKTGDVDFINKATGIIKDIPIIEPKRGHWINVRQEGVCSWTGECSYCHDRNDIPPPILAHFCPNCGADMRRIEND